MKLLTKTLLLTVLISAGCSKNESGSSREGSPTVKGNEVTAITMNSAKCGGEVLSEGKSPVAYRGVVWSKWSEPTVELSTRTSDGSGLGTFTSTITGLETNTTYYVRAYATNEYGTGYGEQYEFTTDASDIKVTTSEVSNITKTSATCGGKVTASSSTISAKGVIWSTEENPTIELETKTDEGRGTGSFTSRITGLESNTRYYVRAYATGTTGTEYGEVVSFVTEEGGGSDLSRNGTANCYIVSSKGQYYFTGTVKGGSEESVGDPSSAEVLWESFGTSVKPSVGDIVSEVSYSDGKVHFTSGENGNAVIAVKDASGTILWSWHIWVCNGFDPEATAQEYNNSAGTMMDRNLGATSATPGDVHALGLMYQWGRKDPFLGASSISSSSIAKSVGYEWSKPVASDASAGTISYAVKHPMQFISPNSKNGDWYYTGSASSTDNTRWKTSGSEKGVYDPCPLGWRVPDGGNTGVWARAFNSEAFVNGDWISSGKGMNFGSTAAKGCSRLSDKYATIWYPASGWIVNDGSLYGVGEFGNYLSGTPYPTENVQAYSFYIYYNGIVNSMDKTDRGPGQSVRCVKE